MPKKINYNKIMVCYQYEQFQNFTIEQLPDSGDIKQMKGHQNKGLFRLRGGEYRIIYSLDDEQLIIYLLDAGNRGEIYRRYS